MVTAIVFHPAMHLQRVSRLQILDPVMMSMVSVHDGRNVASETHHSARRILNVPLLWLIGLYRNRRRSRGYRVCGFHPSCSEYARLCLLHLPLRRALPLIADRLRRCDTSAPVIDDDPPINTDGES